MAAPKPYDQKKRFAHKKGHIVQNHNTEKLGIVVDVQYPEVPRSMVLGVYYVGRR